MGNVHFYFPLFEHFYIDIYNCIFITYGNEEKHYILIDGGIGRICFRQLCKYIDDIKKEGSIIDLLILTHIDSDHIDGILRVMSQNNFDFNVIGEIWFDFGDGLQELIGIDSEQLKIKLYDVKTEISWRQGIDLEEIIEEVGIKRRIVTKLEKISVKDAVITILSPSMDVLYRLAEQGIKEEPVNTEIARRDDYSNSVFSLNEKEFEGNVTLTNESSIAFLFEFNGKKIVFLGDASAEQIVSSLKELGFSNNNKLKVDYCKIAHHASKHNTSNELIQMLDCSNYIISTQRTGQGRPSKECLSRIICNSERPIKFYSNYELYFDNIFTEEEILKYQIKYTVLDENGIDVGEE